MQTFPTQSKFGLKIRICTDCVDLAVARRGDPFRFVVGCDRQNERREREREEE